MCIYYAPLQNDKAGSIGEWFYKYCMDSAKSNYNREVHLTTMFNLELLYYNMHEFMVHAIWHIYKYILLSNDKIAAI